MRYLSIFLLFLYAMQGEDIYAVFDVEGEKVSSLSLSSSGIIKSISANIGDKVKSGEILLELENREQKGELELAKSELKRAELSYEKAEKSFQRIQKIEDMIEEERFDEVLLQKNIAKLNVDIAKNRVEIKEAIYDKTILKAPYDGVITKKFVEIGDGVRGQGDLLFEIVDDSSLKLILGFDQKHWGKVKRGQQFLYRVDGEDFYRKGVISNIYPSANPKDRRIKAEVRAEGIPIGLFGEGYIKTDIQDTSKKSR